MYRTFSLTTVMVPCVVHMIILVLRNSKPSWNPVASFFRKPGLFKLPEIWPPEEQKASILAPCTMQPAYLHRAATREILVSRKKPGFCAEPILEDRHLLNSLKMHLYQYTQKIEHCSNKFDFLPLFCLEGLVPNSVLSGSRGLTDRGTCGFCAEVFEARNIVININQRGSISRSMRLITTPKMIAW